MNVIDKSMEVDNLLGEIQLMRGLSHKHIVEYLGAFVDTEACYLYIFQEWVPGGSVASLLKKFGPFSPSVVKNYTRQILLGLQYLHANGIIHRDIKGGNILVDDAGTVKLADFGASTKLSQFDKTQETTTIKGTPYFMAPEVLSASRYGRKGDIWAVGCTMIQMLTGEPPWKDRNLKGLIQLHLLLSSWNQGPPPYNCELSADGKQCLELCFQKDENERPTASELLQCSFLRDDDLEDSHNSSFNGRSGRGFGDSQRDMLEDSGILTGLKQEINKAVTKSMAGLPPYKPGSEETMQMIDRKIAERQVGGTNPPSKQYPVTPGNPFASRSAADPNNSALPPSGELSVQGLIDKLPSSTFADVRAPKQSREPASLYPAPLSLQPVGGNIGSTGTTPISTQSQNPFSKGVIAIKNNLPQTQTPVMSGMPNSARSEGETQKLHYLPPSSSSTPRSSQFPTTHAISDDNRNANVRDSLHVIKRRANEKAQQSSNAGNRRNSASSVNQSSNRDSEELTPLPLEDDSEVYYPDGRGSPNQREKSLYKDDAKNLFNTRYYEEKRRNFSDEAEEKHSMSGSLSAASSVPLVETSIPKGSLDRGISVESVADDVGENYSKDLTGSREDISLPSQQDELKFMHSSTEFQMNKIGDKSRKYYPSKFPEAQDEDNKQVNAHNVIMRKSSSVNEVRFQSNRSSPVPRLSALDSNQSRQTEKYVSSASARIARTDPVVEPTTRPYSSKASFVYNDSKASKPNSSVHSPETPEFSDRRSVGQGNPFGRSSLSVSKSHESSAGWYCGKCSAFNVPGIQFCEKCATRKGITGDRKNDSVVPRFN
jgi:serine/threonine protein kinase